MANEARDPKEAVPDVQSRLRAMDLCGVLFMDSWGEEAMCILPMPCERHRDAAAPLRQPREVITGYRDQAGMIWPDEDLGARSSFQPLEPVVEVRYVGDVERLREALEEALSLVGHRIFCGRCEEYEPQCGCTPSAAEIRRAEIRRALNPGGE